MILFRNDWLKYPTAIVDVQTKNHTWVRMAQVYSEMNVKNNAFHLALVNPALQGVDPFDPMLSQAQKVQIGIEVRLNPWYYFREVARVPASSGTDRPYIQANRANLSLYWLFFNHVFVILIQPRQTGKSLNVDELVAHLLHVRCTNTSINLLTKDDKLRRENVRRLKDIIAALPSYIDKTTRADSDNGEEITVHALGNRLKTHLPQSNKARANNAARGMTTPIFLIDEGPFQPNIRVSLPAALASMGAATENAKRNGDPYGIIMTTTAGKLDDDSGNFIYTRFVSVAMPWNERLLDCEDEQDLHQTIRAGSRTGEHVMVNATFSHRQMGKTDEWLKGRIASAFSEGDDAARDFLNIWTTGREGSPFSQHVLDAIKKSKVEPSHVQIDPVHKFTVNWYIPESKIQGFMDSHHTVAGLDTSEGTGRDFISLVIVDVRTGGVVATCIINEVLTYNIIGWLADLLERYPKLLLNPERKSTGVTIIDGLLDILPTRGIDPFKRIFNWVVQDPVRNERYYEELQTALHSRSSTLYTRAKNMFGYGTSGSGEQSRTRLFGQTLTTATRDFAERIHDSSLVGQLASLEIRGNRIDHGSGKHDDLVVGWLLAFWVLISGKNLIHYGIEPGNVLAVPVIRQTQTHEQRFANHEQQLLRRRIMGLAQQLAQARDTFVILKLERELTALESQLVLGQNEIFSIEDLLARAKEARRRRKQAA